MSHKASLVDAGRYLLAAYRYIELNPVAAGMQRYPGDYPWFSFRCNAGGTLDDLVCPHPLYPALGEDASSRQSSYRALFASLLPKEVVHEIRMALDFSMPLGNDQFRQQTKRALGRSIGQAKRGRPFARPVPKCERFAIVTDPLTFLNF